MLERGLWSLFESGAEGNEVEIVVEKLLTSKFINLETAKNIILEIRKN